MKVTKDGLPRILKNFGGVILANNLLGKQFLKALVENLVTVTQ